jgi:hypothetical protein
LIGGQTPFGPCSTGMTLVIDNLAPRFTQLDVRRPNQYFSGSHYVEFAYSPTCYATPCVGSYDMIGAFAERVDAVVSSSTVYDVRGDFHVLPETQTSLTFALGVALADYAGNRRRAYATIGPSGFDINPVSVRLERIGSTSSQCLHPDSGDIVSCFPFVPDDGLISIPAVNGVYRLTVYVTDAAGNQSAEHSRITTVAM